jgi:hypothetical protein
VAEGFLQGEWQKVEGISVISNKYHSLCNLSIHPYDLSVVPPELPLVAHPLALVLSLNLPSLLGGGEMVHCLQNSFG